MPNAPFSSIHFAAEEIRRDPGYRFDNARRTDLDQLVIQRTLAGAGFFRDRGGRRLVPAGQAMLFTHREPTGYGYPAEGTEPYRLQFIAFSPAPAARSLFAALREDFGSVVHLPGHSEASLLFDEILQRFRARSFQDRYQEAEFVYRLLTALYRQQVSGTQTSDPVEYGYHYLRNRFRTALNLKQVAQACGVSREHFIREFHRRYRITPAAELRRLRLEHARTLLHSGETSVEAAAAACGFASRNTLTRNYRRRYGASPAADFDARP